MLWVRKKRVVSGVVVLCCILCFLNCCCLLVYECELSATMSCMYIHMYVHVCPCTCVLYTYLFFLEYSDHDHFLEFCESFVPVTNDRGCLVCRLSFCVIFYGRRRGRVGLSVPIPVCWVNIDLERERERDRETENSKIQFHIPIFTTKYFHAFRKFNETVKVFSMDNYYICLVHVGGMHAFVKLFLEKLFYGIHKVFCRESF